MPAKWLLCGLVWSEASSLMNLALEYSCEVDRILSDGEIGARLALTGLCDREPYRELHAENFAVRFACRLAPVARGAVLRDAPPVLPDTLSLFT